jgi:hypothetical protein
MSVPNETVALIATPKDVAGCPPTLKWMAIPIRSHHQHGLLLSDHPVRKRPRPSFVQLAFGRETALKMEAGFA